MQDAGPKGFALKSQLSHEINLFIPLKGRLLTKQIKLLNDVRSEASFRSGIKTQLVGEFHVLDEILLDASHECIEFRSAFEASAVDDPRGEKHDIFKMPWEKSLDG